MKEEAKKGSFTMIGAELPLGIGIRPFDNPERFQELALVRPIGGSSSDEYSEE